MVNTSVFCTSSAPPEARFEAWRESVGVIYEVSREGAPQGRAFHARVESLIIDGIVLNRCTAGGQSFARPAARCATDGLDHYMIQLFLAGSVEMARGRRRVNGRRGQLIALDLADTLDSVNTDFDLLNVFIPRRRLSALLRTPDSLQGVTADTGTGAGKLLADYIVSLYRSGATLGEAEEATCATVLLELAAMAFNASGESGHYQPDWHDHSLALKARMVIGRNLHVRELTPQMIASALNVSRARLYRAFRDIGGVNETIREMRLRRCFSELVSPANTHRPVANIADQWGFTDPSHFARVFRSRFGVTASDVRARQALNAMVPVAPDGPDRSYEAWIASIG
ncbi:hypothetical protein GCM10007420_16440 [Glycocaulis albus]|uniref:HTH araC/xylS-type domain-containing protein n=1 Tax=Glycocaulis albus TaxID=1382801 RepID=A0ABQ1XRF1_9PROT|nr:AraC family transcriptional regulator [Glycocaulis albus]GGH01106.1 hypothetical protein GCM10007420_16440 [Glycocaulis albus]